LTAWKNGGGVTQELLAWPSAEDWCVRLSIATIDKDGAFSALPGVLRWFTVIEGSGINLTFETQKKTVRRGDGPLQFDGHQPCDAALLEGKVTAFNVMMSDTWAGHVELIQAPESVSFSGAGGASVPAVPVSAAPNSAPPISSESYLGLFGVEHCTIELHRAELHRAEPNRTELQLEKHSLLWQPITAPFSLIVHTGALIALHAWPLHV
jgi:hypothetical protein